MILNFDEPKKIHSTTGERSRIPSMSQEDMLKWKAKKFAGADPRIEIRKSVNGVDPQLRSPQDGCSTGECRTQVLAVVREDGLMLSANGRIIFDNKTWREFNDAVEEAQAILRNK